VASIQRCGDSHEQQARTNRQLWVNSNLVSDYAIIHADNLDSAVQLARRCPILYGSGSIEVCETFSVM